MKFLKFNGVIMNLAMITYTCYNVDKNILTIHMVTGEITLIMTKDEYEKWENAFNQLV